MPDDGQVHVTEVAAIVASTHAVAKYGGHHRLTKDRLEEMAEAYRRGEFRFNFSHDPFRPADTKVVSAVVEPTDDGEWRLAVVFQVDDETRRVIEAQEAEARRLGRPSLGMSYSTSVAFARVGDGDPVMLMAVDAAVYTEAEILEAAALLPDPIGAEIAEYVEFALVDHIVNVVFVVQQNPDVHVVELGLIGTAIAGSCKALWRKGRRIRYRVQLRRANGTRTDLITEAESEDDVLQFTSRIRELEDRVSELESELWEFKNRKWIRRLLNR
jgi:hypothetical protein